MSVRQDLRQYILENFLFTDDQSELTDEDSFLEKGILDSTGILELIFFMEDTWKVKVGDDEMVPDNLDSINNAVKYLATKGVEQ